MRIDGSANAEKIGEAGTGRQAQIKRVIKELEERRQALVQKFAAAFDEKKSRPDVDRLNAMKAALRLAPGTSVHEHGAQDDAPAPDDGVDVTDPSPRSNLPSVVGLILSATVGTPASASFAESMLPDDLKLVMRAIMTIDLQIMTLRSQLDDRDAMQSAMEGANRAMTDLVGEQAHASAEGATVQDDAGDAISISDEAEHLANPHYEAADPGGFAGARRTIR